MILADTNNISRGEEIIDEIKDIVRDWDQYARRVEVSSEPNGIISEYLAAYSFE